MQTAEKLVPIFRVKDANKAAHWYARLGFTVVGTHQFAADFPLYMFLDRDGVELHLSEHTGDANPGALCYFWVRDLDQVAREFSMVVKEQPWGREVALTDMDGNRLRLGQRAS